MDPLTITTGILAILGAAAKADQGLRKLLALRGASDQLLQLLNEVNDLRAVLADIQQTLDIRSRDQSAGAIITQTLPALCSQVQRSTNELEKLIATCLDEGRQSDKGASAQKVKKMRWILANEKMKDIQNDIREGRLKLSMAIASMLSVDMLHIRLALQDITSAQSSTDPDPEISRRFSSLNGVPDQVAEILSLLKPRPASGSTGRLIPVATGGYTENDNVVANHVSSAVQPGTRLVEDQGYIRLKFTGHPYRHERRCMCTCHSASAVKTWPLLEPILGSLFIGYSGKVSPFGGPCTNCACTKDNTVKLSLSYYFPVWFLSRALSGALNINRLAGPQFTLKMHRAMPDDSLLFHYARQGMMTEIRSLFTQGVASPFDISSKTGRSALHFAVDFGQEEMCYFLLQQGAEPHHEDKYFMSPFDVAWEKKTEGRSLCAADAFGLANDSYDTDLLQKRSLTSLHRAVLRVSRIDLASQLEVALHELNRRDFFGRTCLSWAAGCGNTSAVLTLLSWKADHTICDQGGWSPLHHAVRAESPSCIQPLLAAGADVNRPNRRGNTPLTVACSYRDSPAHVLPLLEFGADLTTPAGTGLTPLAVAVHANHTRCAQLLVEYGARPNGPENAAAYPIHLAAAQNSHEALRWLLDVPGLDTTVVDKAGWSVLHHAAFSGDKETIEILRETAVAGALVGVDQNLCGVGGETAKDVLEKHRPRLGEDEETYRVACGAFELLLEAVGEANSETNEPRSPEDDWFDAQEVLEKGGC